MKEIRLLYRVLAIMVICVGIFFGVGLIMAIAKVFYTVIMFWHKLMF